MGKELVPEARAWALYLFIKEITQELKDLAIGTTGRRRTSTPSTEIH